MSRPESPRPARPGGCRLRGPRLPASGAGPGTKKTAATRKGRALVARADPRTPGPETPGSARITNYLLGGHDNYAADRAKAAEIEAIFPPPAPGELSVPRQMALDSREFTGRAVRWAARQGVSQFLDLGCGLAPPPPLPAVHAAARSVCPAARVAYVDKDPEACDHLKYAMPGGTPDGIAVICEDFRHPAGIWREAVKAGIVRPGEPVCVLAALVLHLMAPGAARALVRQYAQRAAPGSLIAVSVPHVADEGAWKQLAAACPLPAWNYGEADVLAALDGLEVVPPGICDAAGLRPGWADCPGPGGAAYVIAGIGRVALLSA